MHQTAYLLISLLLVGFASTSARAEETVSPKTQAQIERLTRTVLNQEQQLQQLHEEIRGVRGELEVLNHALKQSEKTRRNVLADMDERLSQLESAPASAKISKIEPVAEPLEAETDVEDTSAPPKPLHQMPSNNSAGQSDYYQKGFAFLQAGRYQDAVDAFKSFQKQDTQGENAANAQYWLAESYYALRDYQNALKEYNSLLENHPDTRKRSNALLKTGYVYYELKDRVMARRILENVIKQYANTNTARLAQERLRALQVEGY